MIFVENSKYAADAQKSGASAAIVPPDVEIDFPAIKSERPSVTFAQAVSILHPQKKTSGGRDSRAFVDPSAKVGEGTDIGPFSTVGANSRIGKNVLIHSNAAIGENVTVGDDCVIYPNVTIYDGSILGARTVIHAGCAIGADGFKFMPDKSGRQIKFQHIGIVRIGDDVEIGANSCVDRAVLDETIIGNGVKLDNLVQVGHNCEIGDNTVVAGCTGIAGSVKIGKNVIIGGQVGFKDHVTIADGVVIAAKSGVIGDLGTRGIYCGMPAVPLGEWRKQSAAISRGPETLKRVARLEKGPRAD